MMTGSNYLGRCENGWATLGFFVKGQSLLRRKNLERRKRDGGRGRVCEYEIEGKYLTARLET